MRRLLPSAAVNGALALLAAATLLPLVWMAAVSLMPAGAANTTPPPFLPTHPTLTHYRALFTRLDLGRNLATSAGIATLATLASLLLNSAAGYAFAKLRFGGRDRLFRTLLLALVVPGQVAMLPLFLLLRSMGLVNTWWGVVLPGAASVFGIFLVRQFALSIPDELLDAARVDGAGELRIYVSVVLPLLKPVLLTLAIFTFLGTWNDFMWPLIVLTDETSYTLPVAVANLIGEHVADTELMMAGSVLTVAPVLLLFVLLQRHYVEGIMAGGLKE